MASLWIASFLCSSPADPLPWRPSGDDAPSFEMPANEGAVGLWLGERADSGDQVVILDSGMSRLKVLLAIETGKDLDMKADDEIVIRLREIFSGDEIIVRAGLGQPVPAGMIMRINAVIDMAGLKGGYYLAIADIMRGRRSLLGGRVGCDDFYVQKPCESMTYTVLSVRAGMALWTRDLLHGDLMGRAKVSLPHVYDPLNVETYADFLKLHAVATWKYGEGNEAGVTGLTFAAEAFRKSGDKNRRLFVERLIKDSVDRSIVAMQAPNGAVRYIVNELKERGIGKHWETVPWGQYDIEEIGELMRAWTYAMLYFQSEPEGKEYAQRLSHVCRKSADYLVAHGLEDSDGISNVIRHFKLIEKTDGAVERHIYWQEGRQCDVYMPRALAGLAWYAYAMQVLGEKVPDAWWPALENTVEWCRRKMKPNGWFDWQCGDEVENGSHIYLGNVYLGEAAFGVYLASNMAGYEEMARTAVEVASKAYHFVIDHCMVHGMPYKNFFSSTSLWPSGYIYWLFTEYLGSVGDDASLADWLKMLDSHFRIVRDWHDLLDRPAVGCDRKSLLDRPITKDDYAHFADTNGMLELAILAYPAIRHMNEIGKPFRLPRK